MFICLLMGVHHVFKMHYFSPSFVGLSEEKCAVGIFNVWAGGVDSVNWEVIVNLFFYTPIALCHC